MLWENFILSTMYTFAVYRFLYVLLSDNFIDNHFRKKLKSTRRITKLKWNAIVVKWDDFREFE